MGKKRVTHKKRRQAGRRGTIRGGWSLWGTKVHPAPPRGRQYEHAADTTPVDDDGLDPEFNRLKRIYRGKPPPPGLRFKPRTMWEVVRRIKPRVILPETFAELVGEEPEDDRRTIIEKERLAQEKGDWLSVNYYTEAIRAMLERSSANAARQGEILGRIEQLTFGLPDNRRTSSKNNNNNDGRALNRKYSRMTPKELSEISDANIDAMTPEESAAYIRALESLQERRSLKLREIEQ